MKNNKGFTITELLVASAISFIVVGSSTTLLFYFFREKNQLDTWSVGQIEMSMAIKNLEGDLRNVVRLEPHEDFQSNQDGLYFGLTDVPMGTEPAACANDANHSVVRYTSLDRFKRQERTLRTWSEQSSVDQTGSEHELRVTADGTEDSLVSQKNLPKELIVVDADRRYARRYEVSGRTFHLNANRDPYDDQPKTDVNGNPILFNYASIFLKKPSTMNGKTATKQSVFITGSDVYASNTYIMCLRKTDNSLIKYNMQTQEETVLVVNNNNEFKINSLKITYLNTKQGVRVDPVNFYPSLLSAPQGHCANVVHATLSAEVTKGQIDAETKILKSDIARSRTIFATNLNSRRALSCLQ